MPTYDTVRIERESGIARLLLNRPDRANTINRQVMADIPAALREIATDGDSRVVILTGAGGRHFCGGADLRENQDVAGLARQSPDTPNGGQAMCDAIAATPLPVIAAINGACMGGGCEIALACDFRVMAEEARIALPEIQFGALPGFGGTQRLPRLVGAARAKAMIFSGRHYPAVEALAIGLVDRVVPGERLLAEAEAWARELLERPAYALAAAKYLVNAAQDVDLQTGLTLERRTLATMATPEERAAAVQKAVAGGGAYAQIFGKRA